MSVYATVDHRKKEELRPLGIIVAEEEKIDTDAYV